MLLTDLLARLLGLLFQLLNLFIGQLLVLIERVENFTLHILSFLIGTVHTEQTVASTAQTLLAATTLALTPIDRRQAATSWAVRDGGGLALTMEEHVYSPAPQQLADNSCGGRFFFLVLVQHSRKVFEKANAHWIFGGTQESHISLSSFHEDRDTSRDRRLFPGGRRLALHTRPDLQEPAVNCAEVQIRRNAIEALRPSLEGTVRWCPSVVVLPVMVDDHRGRDLQASHELVLSHEKITQARPENFGPTHQTVQRNVSQGQQAV